jgi:hypothetical protein
MNTGGKVPVKDMAGLGCLREAARLMRVLNACIRDVTVGLAAGGVLVALLTLTAPTAAPVAIAQASSTRASAAVAGEEEGEEKCEGEGEGCQGGEEECEGEGEECEAAEGFKAGLRPSVKLVSRKIQVSRGKASVRVRCEYAACSASVSVQAAGTNLGHASLKLGKGASATVLVHLAGYGKKLRGELAHLRQHPMSVTVVITVRHGKTTTTKVTLS